MASTSTHQWMTHLYDRCDRGWVTIWAIDATTGAHRTLWGASDNFHDLLTNAKALIPTHNLYFGVATRKHRLQGVARGGRSDCELIPAFWVDIDMIDGHGKHTDPNLPPTLNDAYTLLNTFPLPPTSIIETGGGLQAWWVLNVAMPVDDAAREILDAWNISWQHAATQRGWSIDNVHDIPRVMRLPGTLNHRGNPPTTATVVSADWTRSYNIDDITQWLTLPEAIPATSGTARVDRPGDQWAERVAWRQLLENDGWTWHHHHQGEDYWTRPGKPVRDGTSATTNFEGSDVLKVFTSNASPLVQDATYNKFHYLAVTRFQGDHAAATRWLVEQGYGTPAVERIDPAELIATLPPSASTPPPADTSWVPYDLAPYTDDNYQDPEPTILTRPDGRALIYPEAVNALFGAPGVGKTWVALAAITQHLQAGHKAAFIDLEDHPGKLVKRLKTFGLTNQQITTQFAYIRPDSITYPEAIQATQQLANDGYNLLIIDSYGELLGLAGLDEYSNPDVTANTQGLLRPIVRQGHALIVIDHVIKSNEGTRGYAIGAQRKKAMIDGASWELSSDGYSREKAGTIHLHCAKDRNGWYANREHAADLHLTPTGTRIEWELTVPQDAPDEDAPHGAPNTPTVLMERISQYLADCGANDPQTARNICQAVKGQDSHLRRGLRQLVEQGYVAELDGYNGHPRYANKYEYTEAGSLIEPPPNDDRWYP